MNVQNVYCQTVLTYAAQDYYGKLVKLLIKAGADVNIVNNDGNSALYYLSYFQPDQIKHMKIFLAAEATVNVVNKRGKTIAERSWSIDTRRDSLQLLFAAWKNIPKSTDAWQYVRTMVESDSKLILKCLCREVIREYLLELDQHENLFIRAQRVGLPHVLHSYLLLTFHWRIEHRFSTWKKEVRKLENQTLSPI